MLTRILIQEYKANSDCVDYRNNTPLHYAVINSNIKIVKILLSKGNPRIDIENFDGQTVLKLPMKQDIKNVKHVHLLYILQEINGYQVKLIRKSENEKSAKDNQGLSFNNRISGGTSPKYQ